MDIEELDNRKFKCNRECNSRKCFPSCWHICSYKLYNSSSCCRSLV